jgi:hypothetical protein
MDLKAIRTNDYMLVFLDRINSIYLKHNSSCNELEYNSYWSVCASSNDGCTYILGKYEKETNAKDAIDGIIIAMANTSVVYDMPTMGAI